MAAFLIVSPAKATVELAAEFCEKEQERLLRSNVFIAVERRTSCHA
jgi:hypothetical protein